MWVKNNDTTTGSPVAETSLVLYLLFDNNFLFTRYCVSFRTAFYFDFLKVVLIAMYKQNVEHFLRWWMFYQVSESNTNTADENLWVKTWQWWQVTSPTGRGLKGKRCMEDLPLIAPRTGAGSRFSYTSPNACSKERLCQESDAIFLENTAHLPWFKLVIKLHLHLSQE